MVKKAILFFLLFLYTITYSQEKKVHECKQISKGKYDTNIINKNKAAQFEIYIVKDEVDWQNIVTLIVSLLAIAGAYFGIYKQISSNEKLQNRQQNRQWCYTLIDYISEYINEIDKNKTRISSTILVGKILSDNQAILEIKINLWLDSTINEEKKLMETILSYKKNNSLNTNFNLQTWLEEIKNETHNVINIKW